MLNYVSKANHQPRQNIRSSLADAPLTVAGSQKQFELQISRC
jgi:hypothetical protein